MALILLFACSEGAVVGCSTAHEEPLVEYPDVESPTESAPEGGVVDARARDAEPGEDAQPSLGGTPILTGPVFIRGVTSDGTLVFDHGDDLKVLPAGSSTTTVLTDYDPGFDSLLIRGRFVATWPGAPTAAVPLHVWGKVSGNQTISPRTSAFSFYPKSATDDFAYATPGSDALHRDVWVTKAGAGEGRRIVTDLDTGVVANECKATVAWTETSLLVAGCPDRGTTPKVTVYSLDGSGTATTLLDGSAPGVRMNHARTEVLVQTKTASSIRAIGGNTAPKALDGPVVDAFFSGDDALIVYQLSSGSVKRASTKSPVTAVELAPDAREIYAVSSDARFAVVRTGDDKSRNIVLYDATTPNAPRTLAAENAAFIGLSASGRHAVWLANCGVGLEGTLYVAALPSGIPQKLSELAARVLLDGDIVYWQAFDASSKSNSLKAVRLARPEEIVSIERGLDALTSQAVVVAESLFVGSKFGLTQYRALIP